MILEGIVTTIGTAGVNIAPMGPRWADACSHEEITTFELRPFRTSRTFANLSAHPEGVFHVTDDVLLLAQAAIGQPNPLPPLLDAHFITGKIVADACRAYEFRVTEAIDGERAFFRVAVLHVHRLRDFFGFNRAMFAVLEAAICATRIGILTDEEILAEFKRLAVLVTKTGGPREHQAFELLREHVRQRIGR
jgi:hypothetical protein